MDAADASRASAAAVAIASDAGLTVDDAVVLQNSNKLALRLLPGDAMARVAPAAQQCAAFEVDLAQRLAETDCPVARLDPRVEPCVYKRDGFAVTLWTYYERATDHEVAPADYADALRHLHASMRALDDVVTPHFTDRVAEAQQLVANRDDTPDLTDEDRALIADTLRNQTEAIAQRGAAEQLLHGEPHPGNVLNTKHGPWFIDLETCCRGPVEFDIAHAPEDVGAHYAAADQELVRECRVLVLAMVAAWRWDRADEFPDRQQARRDYTSALRRARSSRHA